MGRGCREEVRDLKAATVARAHFALILFATSVPAFAQSANELVDLINAYRTEARDCDGKRTRPARPLKVNPVLSDGQMGNSAKPIQTLKSRGYVAASAHTLYVTGPGRAVDVMRFIRDRYCTALSNPDVSEIGVERDGRTWHIVLAKPLLGEDLGDWREAGMEVLLLTNIARATGRHCGSQRFTAARALAWNDRLAAAALAHSQDMARRSELSHTGSGGTQSADRATRAGYTWQVVGENIASGQGSAQHAVDSWLSSPVHCATLMDPRFTEMGAAYAVNPGSDATIYWAQEFGMPR